MLAHRFAIPLGLLLSFMKINYLFTACLVLGLAVVVGAFGSHGLKNILLDNSKTEVFETAVRYQFYHGFGLFLVGLLATKQPNLQFQTVFYCFLGGILFFCGSLYVLALTGIKQLGMVLLRVGFCVPKKF
jgi:uncharacterized membrane protein YgdD (TMEM256/DUF423 family)